MSKIFFISDTHFGHTNVIKYDSRPFKSAFDMNETMIRNWNSVVTPEDTVYHLGDFAFLQELEVINILNRLNGQKNLIFGNHDQVIKKSGKIKSMFGFCKDYYEVKHQGETICLFHYPIGEWNKAHRGSYHLHGHCHGNYTYSREGKIMDVGVPCIRYKPISFEEVVEQLSNKPNIEHH